MMNSQFTIYPYAPYPACANNQTTELPQLVPDDEHIDRVFELSNSGSSTDPASAFGIPFDRSSAHSRLSPRSPPSILDHANHHPSSHQYMVGANKIFTSPAHHHRSSNSWQSSQEYELPKSDDPICFPVDNHYLHADNVSVPYTQSTTHPMTSSPHQPQYQHQHQHQHHSQPSHLSSPAFHSAHDLGSISPATLTAPWPPSNPSENWIMSGYYLTSPQQQQSSSPQISSCSSDLGVSGLNTSLFGGQSINNTSAMIPSSTVHSPSSYNNNNSNSNNNTSPILQSSCMVDPMSSPPTSPRSRSSSSCSSSSSSSSSLVVIGGGFKCEYEGCEEYFEKKSIRKRHYQKFTHLGTKPHVCLKCENRPVFQTKQNLSRHDATIHLPPKYICTEPHCKKPYYSRLYEFREHRRNKHPGIEFNQGLPELRAITKPRTKK